MRYFIGFDSLAEFISVANANAGTTVAVASSQPAAPVPAPAAPPPPPAPAPAAPPPPPPVPTAPAPAPAPVAPPAPAAASSYVDPTNGATYTLDHVVAAIQSLANNPAKGGLQAVATILKNHGVQMVPQLRPDQFRSVYEAASA